MDDTILELFEEYDYKQDPKTKALRIFVKGNWEKLDHAVEPLVEEIKVLKDKYHELIMAVGNKYEGETRHETAKRYIQEAEKPNDIAKTCAEDNS